MKNTNTRGRPRGRNVNGKRPPNRNQTFDSNGPGLRVRGNAQQIVEKYLSLARDSASQGDRVMAENYYQHADHYQRILNALTGRYNRVEEQQPAQQPPVQAEIDTSKGAVSTPINGSAAAVTETTQPVVEEARVERIQLDAPMASEPEEERIPA